MKLIRLCAFSYLFVLVFIDVVVNVQCSVSTSRTNITTTPPTKEVQDVKCFSQEGNIDHYYHFFYNCLVPVIIFHERNGKKRLRLCSSPIGEMINIFKDVLPRMQYTKDCGKDVVYLRGYDDEYGTGVKRISSASRQLVLNHFAEVTANTNVTSDAYNATKILLIGRGPPNRPHNRKLGIAPSDTSGAERRAIKNFQELDRALRNKFKSVKTVFLENMTIRQQFLLFQSAKVVVAQHGAALSNLFFLKNSSRGVVEVSPYTMEHRTGKHTHAFPDCFRYIAESMGLRYIRVEQAGEFSDVSIETVVTAATRLLHRRAS
jgi:hypothetical protein